MSGLNLVIVAGRLGKDAELVVVGEKQTPKVTFSLAVNDGEEHVEWIPCVFWGERAEKLAPHLTKGDSLIVEGRWQTHTWEDDAGKHSRTELVVQDVAFGGYNRCTFAGNLGADAELAYMGEKGTPKLTFSLGVNTGFGEHERTEWPRVVIIGKRAESLAAYMLKGTHVLVSGEQRTSVWEDEAGERHYHTELVIPPYSGELVFLGRKPAENAAE